MREGIHWPDVEVVNITSGQPTIHVHGRAAELLAQRNLPGHRVVVHLSLSDTQVLAQAFVVIEIIPDVGP
jgi:holo-[acyl-carrier protein] synthase